MEVVASLSQGRTAAAQCGLFTYKSVPVIFEPPCILLDNSLNPSNRVLEKLTVVQLLATINDLYDIRNVPGVT